ncbi:MAG TPA: response regulator [Chloroflexota bacterium]|jgi:CheY-like chemotaxis protein
MDDQTERFAAQVKDALEHLDDPFYLKGHPLADELLPSDAGQSVGRGQALHRLIVDAIASLSPAAGAPASDRRRRTYQILELRYAEGLPFREVMAELALSQTHYHREQRHALQAITALLWERRPAGPAEADPLRRELEAATHADPSVVDVREVAHGAAEVLRGLAEPSRTVVREELPPSGTLVAASRTMLRQLLIGMGGYVLQASRGGELALRCAVRPDGVALAVVYRGELAAERLDDADVQEILGTAARMLEPLGGSWRVDRGSAELSVTAELPPRQRTLLVVDDNPDMVQLITRFVTDQGYAVLSAASVREGLALAHAVQPDAILLDIMMPDQDGWDALQSLRHHPRTQDVPIVVCTVLAESQLARALGATAFLRKPLTRPALLEALARLGRSRPGPAAGRPEPSGPSAPAR